MSLNRKNKKIARASRIPKRLAAAVLAHPDRVLTLDLFYFQDSLIYCTVYDYKPSPIQVASSATQ